MAITREEVLKIAALAKLQFSPSELDAFTAQFQHILDYIEKLEEVNIEGVEPTSYVSDADAAPRSRDDQPRPSLAAAQALENAPDPGSGHFRVPSVLKQE